MAKLSAHGSIVGTVTLTTVAKRYMSDGVILVNKGFGWKLGGKVKAGVTPQEAFRTSSARVEADRQARPAYAAYQAAMVDACGLCHRWKLQAAIQLMPDDCDGVWSEVCDGYGDNPHLDVDEVRELCRLYKAAIAEHEARKAA